MESSTQNDETPMAVAIHFSILHCKELFFKLSNSEKANVIFTCELFSEKIINKEQLTFILNAKFRLFQLSFTMCQIFDDNYNKILEAHVSLLEKKNYKWNDLERIFLISRYCRSEEINIPGRSKKACRNELVRIKEILKKFPLFSKDEFCATCELIQNNNDEQDIEKDIAEQIIPNEIESIKFIFKTHQQISGQKKKQNNQVMKNRMENLRKLKKIHREEAKNDILAVDTQSCDEIGKNGFSEEFEHVLEISRNNLPLKTHKKYDEVLKAFWIREFLLVKRVLTGISNSLKDRLSKQLKLGFRKETFLNLVHFWILAT